MKMIKALLKLKDIKTLGNYSEMGMGKFKDKVPRNYYGRLNIIHKLSIKNDL